MARAVNLEMSGVISRARRADGLKAITLNLGPLLAPHRKHGRLSLRIERLPQQARFSAGRMIRELLRAGRVLPAHADAGMTGVAGDGKTITCENNNGLRWEPT